MKVWIRLIIIFFPKNLLKLINAAIGIAIKEPSITAVIETLKLSNVISVTSGFKVIINFIAFTMLSKKILKLITNTFPP